MINQNNDSGRCQTLLKKAQEIFIGKDKELSWAICAFLSKGHVLFEDLPGVGKTTLVYMFSRLFGMNVSRIQFTNDLLPSDIVGSVIFQQSNEQFSFRKGPLFGEVILADELNRATPKTQSALLQAMEEGFVSVDGHESQLDENFLVLATQNPIQQIGTFPLPESQLDRFFMSISLGFPDKSFERIMIKNIDIKTQVKKMESVFKPSEIPLLRLKVQEMEYSEQIVDYILRILEIGRVKLDNGFALSPRCGKDLLMAAKSYAFIQSREFVLPDDVQFVAPAVLAHRLGGSRGVKAGLDETQRLLENVPVV